MAVFPLKILTPDGVAFDGSVSAVSCRTINGQIQLLAKHIDYCTALGMGEAHITLEDGTIRRQLSPRRGDPCPETRGYPRIGTGRSPPEARPGAQQCGLAAESILIQPKYRRQKTTWRRCFFGKFTFFEFFSKKVLTFLL